MLDGDIFGGGTKLFDLYLCLDGAICELLDLSPFLVTCTFEGLNSLIQGFQDLPLNIVCKVGILRHLGDFIICCSIDTSQTIVDSICLGHAILDLTGDQIVDPLLHLFPDLIVIYILLPRQRSELVFNVKLELLDAPFSLDGQALHLLQL